MRSFKNEDVYTPIPNTNTSLVILVAFSIHKHAEHAETYPLAVPAKPKKKSMGSATMKKVCVPNELVYTKYLSQNGVRILACIFARIADSL